MLHVKNGKERINEMQNGHLMTQINEISILMNLFGICKSLLS